MRRASPAQTRRAKTEADARLIRTLLAEDRLPECYIAPAQVLEYRALLELYHALRREHTAWVQRIHAVLFHQGAEDLGSGALSTVEGRERLVEVVAAQLSPAGQIQIATGIEMLEATERHLEQIRRQLVGIARHVRGAKTLTDSLYGVGPITALALTCWLGGADRFSSAGKAVRFAGLDVTVYSSAGKRSPGHLSRQGPPVLRWCLYEAGHTHARDGASDHGYYANVKHRIDGKRAALSEARKIVRHACHILTDLGDAVVDERFASDEDLARVRASADRAGFTLHVRQVVRGRSASAEILDIADDVSATMIVIDS